MKKKIRILGAQNQNHRRVTLTRDDIGGLDCIIFYIIYTFATKSLILCSTILCVCVFFYRFFAFINGLYRCLYKRNRYLFEFIRDCGNICNNKKKMKTMWWSANDRHRWEVKNYVLFLSLRWKECCLCVICLKFDILTLFSLFDCWLFVLRNKSVVTRLISKKCVYLSMCSWCENTIVHLQHTIDNDIDYWASYNSIKMFER
jgi:hypothetical protein